MIDYTIIIPAYNCGKYIEACLKSIYDVLSKNVEVIVIDDGSKDNTKEVCKKFVEQGLVYVYQENQGVSRARNRGLEMAQGKYILFVDADDMLDPLLKKGLLYSEMQNKDLHVFSFYSFNENGEQLQYCHPNEQITVKEYLENPDKWIFHYMNAPFAKVYKREIIENSHIRFDEDFKIGEDLMFNLSYISVIETISVSTHMVYAYRIHAESVMNKFYTDLSIKQKELAKRVFEIIDKIKIDANIGKTKYLIDTFNFVSNYYYRNSTLSKVQKMKFVKECLVDFACLEKRIDYKKQKLKLEDVLLLKAISYKSMIIWVIHKFILKVYSMKK